MNVYLGKQAGRGNQKGKNKGKFTKMHGMTNIYNNDQPGFSIIAWPVKRQIYRFFAISHTPLFQILIQQVVIILFHHDIFCNFTQSK
jgi:hypothetical protein